MSRPTTRPTWDSNATNIVTPPAGNQTDGFADGVQVPAARLNFLFYWYDQWLHYLATGTDVAGDGSDGNVTVSTQITLSRDMFYNDLTVSAGGEIISAGFRIYVKGTLTTSGGGKITANGATGGAPPLPANYGVGSASGTVGGGFRGGAGSDPGGTAEVGLGGSVPQLGGAGGTGGGNPGAGGGNGVSGGTAGAYAATKGTVRGNIRGTLGHSLGIVSSVSTWTVPYGGSGGGGAGGGSANDGPGGGGGGGVLAICAQTLNLASAGDLKAAGGNGRAGTANSGGSGGGGGGALIIAYGSKNAVTFSAATNCPGGTAGSAGTGGATAGVAGSNGTVIEWAL